jgi:hypothetical protein
MVLDVIHFIPDAALVVTLERIRGMLADGGLLIIRSIVRPTDGGSFWWRAAALRRALTGARAFHRTHEEIRRALQSAGFEAKFSSISGGNAELWWFGATLAGVATSDGAARGK